MTRHVHRSRWFALPVIVATLTLGAQVPSAGAANGEDRETAPLRQTEQANVVQLKDARLKIELNATDGDAGIQVFIDAEPWESISIFDPNGEKVFQSVTRGRFAKQGGTELFLESAEPNFSQLTLEKFLKRFPAGKYKFRGEGLNGERYVGSATLTHNLPGAPRLVYPLEGSGPQDPHNTVLMWEPVGPVNGSPIIAYQVLIVQLKSDFPAIPKVALDIFMPATATRLAVPPGFLLANTEYEWEVIAIEAGGNQTLSTSFFRTAL